MNFPIPIINQTLELSDCRDKWFFDEKYQVWCLEDILYTLKATTPKFQRMSIFVPKPYLNSDGTVNENGSMGVYTAKTAPVVFENNSAGYMQMPHTWLGGPRDEAEKYLERGMVYVTCGSRGRESRDKNGKLCGKSPWTLVDLKTGIRFLRHNASVLPGDFDKIISVGWSAGGAMSTLVGVTGNNPNYDSFLEENGAFMDESDAVLAAQIYCPIIDLDHADIAYEWQFCCDEENEASPAGPAGKMSPFQKALSEKLKEAYISYFNDLALKDADGSLLTLSADGRSGSGYDYLMRCLGDSATKYLTRLANGLKPETYSVADYLSGNYTHKVPAPHPSDDSEGKDDVGLHHAGAAVMMPPKDLMGDDPFPGDRPPKDDGPFPGDKPPFGEKPSFEGKPPIAEKRPMGPPSLGDLVSRPPKGIPYIGMEFPMIDAKGTDKTAWLAWDGEKATISSLDAYILNHRRRMKPCTSFDTLGMDSGENQEFGTSDRDYMHFDEYLAPAIQSLREEFPDEYDRYYQAFAEALGDEELARRRYLINPFNYIGTTEQTDAAAHYRIRVGAQDADTAFTVSMALALKLENTGKDTDYALIWDKPHCEADYPGEVCDWIESFTK